MRLLRFLNQTATFEKRVSDEEGWGGTNYEAPVEIRARVKTQVRIAKSSRETRFYDITKYLTEQEVRVGDRLNGEIIHAVENIVSRKGKLLGCKSFHKPPTSFSDF